MSAPGQTGAGGYAVAVTERRAVDRDRDWTYAPSQPQPLGRGCPEVGADERRVHDN